MPNRYRFTVVTFAVLFLAVGFALVSAFLVYGRMDSLEGTDAADATVVSVGSTMEPRQNRAGNTEKTWAKVRFTLPDGRAITATLRPAPETNGRTTVRIRYKRVDPRIVTEVSASRHYVGGAIFLALGLLCLVLAHFVSLRDGVVQGRIVFPGGRE